jgi:hypothetical protein
VSPRRFGFGGGLLLLLFRVGKQEIGRGGEKSASLDIKSDFFVVAGHADEAGHVVVLLVFVLFEECVVVVIADIDIIVAEVGQVFAGRGFLVGILQRHDLDALVLGIDFRHFFLLGHLLENGGNRGLGEEGERVALARIGRYDRILVQVVEFLARFRVDALGTKFILSHVWTS